MTSDGMQAGREASQTSFDEEVSGYADGKCILRCAWAISALASVGYATVAAGCVCVSVRRPSAAAGSTVRVQPIPTSVCCCSLYCVCPTHLVVMESVTCACGRSGGCRTQFGLVHDSQGRRRIAQYT